MRDIIIALIVFGTLPVVLMRPHVGILLWSWISYMNPHRMAYGFAFNFPWAALTAGAIFAGLLFSREPKRVPWNPVTAVWLLWVMWMGVTTIFALVPANAMAGWDRSFKIQLMTLITLVLMGKRERLNQLVWIIVFSLGYFGVKGGVFALLTGGADRVWGPPDSFIEGNNELALALIMVLPLMRYLQLHTQNKWLRRALLGAMLLTAFSILASYSRGAFLAAGAMAFMFWVKSRRKLLIGLGLVAVAASSLAFMPEKWFERMDTITEYKQDASAMGRINAWTFALNVAADRPIVGGGFNTFTPSLFQRYAPNPNDFHDAHSIYFQVLGEHGYIGLFLFMTLWLLTFRTGRWVARNTRDKPDLIWARDLAAMLQVSLVGYAVGGAFLGLAYFDLPYHLMTMLVLTRAIVTKEIAKTAEIPSEFSQTSSRTPITRPVESESRG